MKILILGHGRHGKDTVAQMIYDETGMKFKSSSEVALDVIWPALRESARTFFDYVKADFVDKQTAFSQRYKYRNLWKELILLYNTPDKSALTKLILSENDIYVGMRCHEEYEASKNMFDIVIWVDRSVHIGADSSMSIQYDAHSMHWINNNQSLEITKLHVDKLLSTITRDPKCEEVILGKLRNGYTLRNYSTGWWLWEPMPSGTRPKSERISHETIDALLNTGCVSLHENDRYAEVVLK